jgi:hypothetical protein
MARSWADVVGQTKPEQLRLRHVVDIQRRRARSHPLREQLELQQRRAAVAAEPSRAILVRRERL